MSIRRRQFLASAVGTAMATTLWPGSAAAQTAQSETPSANPKGPKSKQTPLSLEEAKAMGKVTLLFVQSAQGSTLENDKLTLKGIAPATIFFSDRPERIAGHLSTKEFVPFWSEGKDSFAANPPNATLSIFSPDGVQDIVLELRNPQFKGNDLNYDVRLLEGPIPTGRQIAAGGGACSLFIDVIGMPLTPYSYAGAARRAYRWR
jgi:hypothetical protein